MTHFRRARLVRVPHLEEEIHITNNPLYDCTNEDLSIPVLPITRLQAQREILTTDDYQAPLTSFSLKPNSHWLTVRRNIHRIRFMGLNNLGKTNILPDLYLGFQMTRELLRAQAEIKNIDKQKDFHIVKEFTLAGNHGTKRKFDTSHVTADDALIYDRLGEEPLALQNLLYYFSKQNIEHGTVFWEFLYEVNHVLNLKRKRTALVRRLRRIAFTLAVVLYCCIGLMFCLMIMSVVITTAKLDDPEVEWLNRNLEEYNLNLLSLR